MFFWIFIGLIIVQRLIELVIAKRNENILLKKGALVYDNNGYRFVVVMHIAFFASIITEKILFKTSLNTYWIYFIVIFAAAQLLRYWAIASLGEFWNTKIIVLKGSQLVKKGPYKFINHPNYAAVMVEIAVLPVIFSCYVTFVLFSITNFLVLIRRIKIEEKVLRIKI